MQNVVKGQNNIPNNFLDGADPDDVADDPELKGKLQNTNEEYYKLNTRQLEDQAITPEAAGKYRTLLNRPKFNRGWQPPTLV